MSTHKEKKKFLIILENLYAGVEPECQSRCVKPFQQGRRKESDAVLLILA